MGNIFETLPELLSYSDKWLIVSGFLLFVYSKFFQKELCRSNQSAYSSAFRFMIDLDQEAQKKYLERFDAHIKLTYHKSGRYSFPVTV